VSDRIRLLAGQAGILRALELFPESVNAAAERGLRPLGDPPAAIPPTAAPAPVFDPARFERNK
jgi:hypothetical protein